MNFKSFAACFLALALCVPAAAGAADQWKPKKAVTIMTPTPAGSSGDMILRAGMNELKAAFGTAVVVSPTPGGQNTQLITKMMSSPRDGSTIIVHGSPRICLANIFREDPFKYEELRPLLGGWRTNTLFVTKPGSGDFKAFVEKAKANPGKLNVGVMGVPTGYHGLVMAAWAKELGFEVTIVPFQGAGPVVSAILGGHIDAGFIEQPNSAVEPILLVSGKTDIPDLQNVPTPADLGLPEPLMTNYNGFFVPADLPEEIVSGLESILIEALKSEEMKKVAASFYVTIAPLAGAEYGKWLDGVRQKALDLKASGAVKF
ncbi:MAG: hypothetical protein J5855_02875 [Mailhella sp.]|nr:hypothetical protein [Mailhella sp.]